jgi:hypothetical protein
VKSYGRYLICVAWLLIAAVLPASAGSTKTYTYSDPVTGNSGITGVTTNFTFNPTNDKVTAGTLTFKGAFGTFNVSFTASCPKRGSCVFDVSKTVRYEGITYTIIDAINLSQLSASGIVLNDKTGKIGDFDGSFASVPEGGSRFAYLAPAGLVIFGGIFLSGFLRSRIGRQENV